LSVDLLTFECLGSSSYFCLVWFSILYLISYLCRVVLPSWRTSHHFWNTSW